MGIFEVFTKHAIDEGVEEYKRTSDAVLLDVRTQDEYTEGHIEGSCNLPLHEIEKIKEIVSDKNAPIFVYCRSGARSGQAAALLHQFGYKNVKNIGGIMHYHGKVVK